jgi:DeoR family fructose operon transcriptional repressor
MADPRIRFPQQRQEYVLAQLSAHGRVEAARLAEELGVSSESIRKDLGILEERGLLRRVHGGAIPVRKLTFEPAVHERTEFGPEKEAIAKAALAHVPPGGTILIDAGSTTARLAELLPDAPLAVYTNALPVASTLAAKPSIAVRTLGGTIRRPTLATVGQDALDQLASINVDVGFLGTNGISFSRGLTTPDDSEAAVKSAMVGAASRRILLADHSKFGLVSLCRHASLTDLDLLITDSGISASDLAGLEEIGVPVEIAR